MNKPKYAVGEVVKVSRPIGSAAAVNLGKEVTIASIEYALSVGNEVSYYANNIHGQRCYYMESELDPIEPKTPQNKADLPQIPVSIDAELTDGKRTVKFAQIAPLVIKGDKGEVHGIYALDTDGQLWYSSELTEWTKITLPEVSL